MGQLYGLKVGHPMPFRRTIRAAEPYQLVFQPNEPLELNDDEVAGLKKEIAARLIVPWEVSDNDHRTRRRPLRPKATEEAAAANDEEEAAASEVGSADASDSDAVAATEELAGDDALLGDEGGPAAADEGGAVAATGGGRRRRRR